MAGGEKKHHTTVFAFFENHLRNKTLDWSQRLKTQKEESVSSKNKKFWKELICLLSLHYLKMSFALKLAFAPT
jgi:hypothetical protein